VETKTEDINTKITENSNVISSSANFNITNSSSANFNITNSSSDNFNITNSNSQNQIINSNPNSIINLNFNRQNYLQDTENRKKKIEATKKEFNDLADFLNIRSSDEKGSSGNSGQFFKIDLFSNNNKKPNSNKMTDKDDEYDVIEIERDNNAMVTKVKNMFDDFNLNNNEEQDDLLELMDMACKK